MTFFALLRNSHCCRVHLSGEIPVRSGLLRGECFKPTAAMLLFPRASCHTFPLSIRRVFTCYDANTSLACGRVLDYVHCGVTSAIMIAEIAADLTLMHHYDRRSPIPPPMDGEHARPDCIYSAWVNTGYEPAGTSVAPALIPQCAAPLQIGPSQRCPSRVIRTKLGFKGITRFRHNIKTHHFITLSITARMHPRPLTPHSYVAFPHHPNDFFPGTSPFTLRGSWAVPDWRGRLPSRWLSATFDRVVFR